MSELISCKKSPGPIILFGSGETLPSSGPAYDYVASEISNSLDISILETPAGFQLNSENVAQNVADFIGKRLQNYNPKIHLIPARAKKTDFSPNDTTILEPMLSSNWVFMGPGSPTYTVRQLKNSLALKYLTWLHYLGTALTFSSAAVLAISSLTIPIYEIYKVGEDLHWIDGLNFLDNYGLDIVWVPHWNNHDGGENLDTSRCFMGIKRFDTLKGMLKSQKTIIGIDEQTALCLPFSNKNSCMIFGKGSVTIIKGNNKVTFKKGEYKLADLGLSINIPERKKIIADETWNIINSIHQNKAKRPPLEIEKLVTLRESARAEKNWAEADLLRLNIEDKGWSIEDTSEGPVLVSKE
jgi:hypothetical protein